MHRKSLDRCRYPLNEHIDLIKLLLIKILKSKLVRDNCMFTNACIWSVGELTVISIHPIDESRGNKHFFFGSWKVLNSSIIIQEAYGPYTITLTWESVSRNKHSRSKAIVIPVIWFITAFQIEKTSLSRQCILNYFFEWEMVLHLNIHCILHPFPYTYFALSLAKISKVVLDFFKLLTYFSFPPIMFVCQVCLNFVSMVAK